jgi:hypothetical protein
MYSLFVAAINECKDINTFANMKTTNERILFMIKHFCEGNKAEFARIMEEKPQTIQGWLSRKNGNKVLAKILDKFPMVNPAWLYTGIGDMLDEESDERVKDATAKEVRPYVPSGLEEHLMEKVKIRLQNTPTDDQLKIKINPIGTQRASRGIVERLHLTVPELKEERKPGVLTTAIQELLHVAPSKGIFVATGQQGKTIIDITELEALKGQIKALQALTEAQARELDILREVTATKIG